MGITISPIDGTISDDTLIGSSASEVLSGWNGNDVILSKSGHDEGWGGKGDDLIEGNSGDDTLYGDASPQYADLKELFITYDYPVTVTFEGEGAGYKNTFGWYKIDPLTGQIKDVEVIWKNASQVGSGGDLVPGVTQQPLDVSAGDQIGFFIVSNGYSLNTSFFESAASNGGRYEFRDSYGSPAGINDVDPTLYHIADDGTVTLVLLNDYHTAAYDETLPLNSDGILHTVGQLDTQNGVLELGFEDLYNGGDLDFDDTVFSVDIGTANIEVLNAHSSYGASGFDVVNGAVVVRSDLENDFNYIDPSAVGTDHWDISHMTMTNSDDNLIFVTSIYDANGFDLFADQGTISLFLVSGKTPIILSNTGDAVVLPDVDGVLINMSIISGLKTITLSEVAGGVAQPSASVPLSSLSINDGMLRAEVSLSELGLAVGDQISWIGYADSINNGFQALDVFDSSKSYEIASFNDTLSGHNGSDLIFGQKGSDVIDGGDGGDTLNGGSGSDIIDGGSGDDVLYGNSGDDRLSGGNSNDYIAGGSGADSLYGDDGLDRLEGHSGDDYLNGGSGSDTLVASSGNDTVDGGSGNDDVSGGSGNDYLIADIGDDTLNGGSGIDTLSFENAATGINADLNSKTSTGIGTDEIYSIENLKGSDYNDILYGNFRENTIEGGDGRDRLYGRGGDDHISGGNGRDYLVGGSGEDSLFGEDGNDVIKGYKGIDYLTGGAGSDRFVYKSLNEVGDFITDFDFEGDQDQIDIASIFNNLGISDTSNVLGTYIQYTDNGSGDAIVQLDQTGSGSIWDVTIVILSDFDSQDLDISQFILE